MRDKKKSKDREYKRRMMKDLLKKHTTLAFMQEN